MDDLIIYNTDDGEANVSLLAKDGTVWCTQAQMAELFNVQKAAISKHLKNLFEDGEVDKNSVVSILESAEFRVKLRKDLTLSFWREEADRLLTSYGIPVLDSAGTVSHKQMMNHVDAVYSAFDAKRKSFDAEAADREDLEELEQDAKWLAASKVSNKK